MFRWIVGASMKFRLLVSVVAAGILALGVVQLNSARVDALPEFNPPYIEIQTEALGLSASEVEQLITVPLEADLLNGVAFLKEIRSDSIPGLSSVVLLFEPGTDLFRARQLVQEKMTQAHALPHVSKPPVMLEPRSSSGRVMVVGMSSDTLSLIDQSVLARWTIRPRLLGVPGVANVSIFGQRERQLQVEVDPAILDAKEVGLDDVLKTVGNAMWVSPLTFLEASTPGAGGFIDTPNQRLAIRNISPIVDAESLSQVVMEGTEEIPGLRLPLGEATTVVEDHQPLIGDGLTRDASGLTIVVEKLPNTNTRAVTEAVERALAELAPGLTGVKIDPAVYRPASFVDSAMDNLTVTLLVGLLLAAMVLGLLLYSRRTAVVALLTIPVSVLAAAVVLSLFGSEINLLLIAGLVAALAVVVADAVADSEAIAGRLRAQREAGNGSVSRAGLILRASVGARRTIVYPTLIVLLALVPVAFLPESPRDFVAPLVLGFVAATLAATLVALTLTPALSVYLLVNEGPAKPSRLQSRMAAVVESISVKAAPNARRALVLTAALVLVGLALLPLLRTALVPTFKEPDLLVQLDGAVGTSRPEMSRIAGAAAAELRGVPGVADVSGHVGRALLSDRVGDVNEGQLWVKVDPDADYAETVAAVREVVGGYLGLNAEVTTFLSDRSAGVLTPAPNDLVVRVYGENSEVLNAKADEVAALLRGVEGARDPRVLRAALQPTLQVKVDLAAAQRVGIKPGDVRRTVATLVAGLEVGSIFEQQKVFEVIVRGVPQIRESVTGIQNMLIDAPEGQVRLRDIATVEITPVPNVIQREAVSRYVDVVAGVDGRGYGAVAAEVQEKLRTVAFPFEHRAAIMQNDANRDATTMLIGVTVLAVLAIFLVLHVAFGSWRLAAGVFAALAAALTGGLLAALVTGAVVSLGTLVGLVAVLAVAARLTVGQILHYQRLAADGVEFSPALVARGMRERLGPALITVLAVALLFVPFGVAGPIAGLELMFPMALTVLTGLVSTCVVLVFVVPALFLAAGDRTAEDDLGIDPPMRRDDELVTTPAKV